MSTQSLTKHIEARIDELSGVWVALPRNYESGCAEALGATVTGNRYFDCELGAWRIELKKTRSGSMWFDLVRYSEALADPSLAHDVVTLVMRYTLVPVPQIRQVAIIRHERLIEALRLTPDVAEAIARLASCVPRSLNAQASLTWLDITKAADSVVARH